MLRNTILRLSGEDTGEKRLVAKYGSNNYEFNPTSEFWECYLLSYGEEEINITEKQLPGAKKKLSVDIRVGFDENYEGGCTDEQIDSVVSNNIPLVVEAVENHLMVSDSKIETTCIYLRREDAIINNMFVGKLVFPYIHGTEDRIKEISRSLSRIMQKTHRNNLISGLTNEVKTAYKDMFRVNEANPKLMGSKEGSRSLEAFQAFCDGVPEEFPEFSQDLFPFPISDMNLDTLPLVLTSWYADNFKLSWYADEVEESEEMEESEEEEYLSPEEMESRNRTEEILSLITIISDKRGKNFHDWIDIGSVFLTINDGLNHWKKFTSRCGKFTDEDCDLWWHKLHTNNDFMQIENTVRTLRFFAVKDNAKMYMTFIKPEIDRAVDNMIQRGTSGTIAELFYLYFPYQFACSRFEANEWWFYGNNQHSWKECQDDLDRYIVVHFKPLVEKLKDEYVLKQETTITEEERKRVLVKIQGLNSVLRYLEEPNRKANLRKELRGKYYMDKFEMKKDEMRFFMVLKNGVVDTRDGTAVIRPGKPEDYITKIPVMEYDPNLSVDSYEVKETKKYFHEVFRNKEVEDFMFMVFSSLLEAGNHHKHFIMLSGGGNNSKSALQNIVKAILGKFKGYFCSPSSNLITEKRGHSNNASAGMVVTIGTRAAFFQEPDEGDVINTGFIKQWTGGDEHINRDLYQRGSDTVPKQATCIPFLCTNHPIVSHDVQDAFWNRLVPIKLSSIWSDGQTVPVPETYEEQLRKGVFPMDPDFESKKAPIIAKGLLWMMIKYYPEYKKRGEKLPKTIMEERYRLKKANNPFFSFADDMLEKKGHISNEEDGFWSLNVTEAFKSYNLFVRSTSMNVKRFSRVDFVTHMSNYLGSKPERDAWNGWRLNHQKMSELNPQ